ncbi:MAG: methyltransferase type 11 [Nitrospira sp.]|nr:methyltransferase type 11 [Nitrospira sp.]
MTCHAANDIPLGGSFFHRKEWEFIFVTQALYERGFLCSGSKGLGFAVGREPLPCLFASRGVAVMATDAPYDFGTWRHDYAANVEGLYRPEMCCRAVFDKNVRFMPLDMSELPGHLGNFDFSWSCCAVEHLGSLEAGLSFMAKQMRYLRYGGISVHTTEFNLSSNDETLATGPTVLFRRRDIEAFAEQILLQGDGIAPFDCTVGSGPLDKSLAVFPWNDFRYNNAHLQLMINRFRCTSAGIILSKGKYETEISC